MATADFIEELAQEIETTYKHWGQFHKSVRHATHSALGVIELMPASDDEQYAFKYVNGHPANTAKKLLTVMAFGMLADVETGYPLMLSEMTLLTALRTAATSALAACLLARPESHSMALIGNGSQAEFQAIAFYHAFGLRELRLYDVDKAATEKLQINLERAGLEGLEVIVCNGAYEAAANSDIITTITADKRNAVILTPEMVSPGTHINAVGGDCPGKTELHPDLLHGENVRVVVEFEPQSRIEGEIQQMPSDFPVTELAEVLNGRAIRASTNDITIFDSVGFALEDFAALRYVYRLQREQREKRIYLDLIPELKDPKNLYSLVSANHKAGSRRRYLGRKTIRQSR